MKRVCKACNNELQGTQGEPSPYPVTGGMCSACKKVIVTPGSSIDLARFLDSLHAPILLMQPEPRQVFTANQRALELFDKDVSQVAGHRGGQVFDCIHSYTEAGCGKDVHCDDCKIKNAVVETFTTGKSFNGVSTELEIRKISETTTYHVQVSTEKLGNWALLRVDKYKKIT